MKKLKIYVVVDEVAENILTVFSAVSDDMARRQYDQALEANKDNIYDKESICLYTVKPDVLNSVPSSIFRYSVPESFAEVKESFEDININF